MLCLGCSPVMSVAEAPARLGVSRRQVSKLVADGVLTHLNRVLVVGACVIERASEDRLAAHRLRLDVLLRRYGDAVSSHESAALTSGLPVLRIPPYAIVTRSAGAWRGGKHERVRIAPLPPHHCGDAAGTPLTTDARTVVDIARSSDLRAAAVVGDAALRRGVTAEELRRTLDEVATWADVGRAAKAIGFLDARAESPFESLSRATMSLHDVPSPELQRTVRGASGSTYRADFSWGEARVIGEADGRQKYFANPDGKSAHDVLWAEKVREDDLREAGYDFVRWTYWQMLNDAPAVVSRILRKLASRFSLS